MSINQTIRSLSIRATQNTPFFISFQGPGYLSELKGFLSLDDCRKVVSIVKQQGTFNGVPVDWCIVKDQDGSIYRGRLDSCEI
jgi:hypothetical protein